MMCKVVVASEDNEEEKNNWMWVVTRFDRERFVVDKNEDPICGAGKVWSSNENWLSKVNRVLGEQECWVGKWMD
jgi:hypothetical protein